MLARTLTCNQAAALKDYGGPVSNLADSLICFEFG
jgi:hypothetical protein